MNLLSNNVGKDIEMQKKILNSLRLGLSDDEMKIAENFFDFSKKLDISLIENLTVKGVKFFDKGKAHSVFFEMQSEKDFKYSDRYILFLDVILSNQFISLLSYHYNIEYMLENDVKFKERIIHALKQRYTDEEVNRKYLGYLAEAVFYSNNKYRAYFPQKFEDIAKKNPEKLLDVADNYCDGAIAKLCLYALILACDNFENEKLSETMAEYILSKSKESVWLENDERLMSVLFMAVNHSDKIKSFLENRLKDKEGEFLEALLTKVPCSYIEKNVDKIFDILGNDEKVVLKCAKISSSYSWTYHYYSDILETKARTILKYICIKYPQQFVKVMTLAETIPERGRSAYTQQDKYYCCFYGEMYDMAEKENSQIIKDYNLNPKEDTLNLVILSEKRLSKVAQKEIGKYLEGSADISILEPYFDILSENYIGNEYKNNKRLVNFCMKLNPDFKNRYYALKVIQKPSLLVSDVRYDKEKYQKISEFVKALLTEKVPVERRFDFYDTLYNDYNVDKEKMEKIILNGMVSFSNSYNESYDSYCPAGSVLARKLYVMYLGETDTENKNKDKIFSVCADTSKEVKKALVSVLSKNRNYESDVLKLLNAKKISVREVAIDVLDLWGADQYKEVLEETAEKEKSVKLADKIRDMLSMSKNVEGENGETLFSAVNFVKEIHRGGRVNKISWLYRTPNTEVHFNNGSVADNKYMQALLLCYAVMDTYTISENANMLARELKQNELNKFASDIFSKWVSDGADTKKKWVMYFSAIHGGYDIIDVFLKCIKDWAENMRGAIASEAVKALALNGSSHALMAVDNMAHKFKQKQVKNSAINALENVAEQLGITSDELGDRIVPDLGFNENMERIFDYGTRKFKVYLTPSLELEVYGENDKKLKTMPSPSKKDNEEIAKQSNTEFKQMKKQLKNVISIQKLRLETALLADRRWNREDWEKLFVKNPVMHSFAIGLVWSAYENDEFVATFRYMEDGTFNTADEDEYQLSENCTIGLVHPIDLDEETLSQWKEQLEDYEIIQPIEQLERKIYRVEDKEKGSIDLKRFEGRSVNGMSLLGRTAKFGWYKGSIQDAGCFSTFYREDVVKRVMNSDGTVKLFGNAVEMNFEGMYVAGENAEVKIENVRFYMPGSVKRGSYVYDEVTDKKAIKLENVNPRYFSEIVNQLDVITKSTSAE